MKPGQVFILPARWPRQELPDLDVSMRGAVSIARRVQDPLAELVKIEPKSIGIGLYQHDVDQTALGKALQSVVEIVVNQVGVDCEYGLSSLADVCCRDWAEAGWLDRGFSG